MKEVIVIIAIAICGAVTASVGVTNFEKIVIWLLFMICFLAMNKYFKENE